MATATGTNVKFVKVQTKQQYNDYTDKDGALIFVENERKIYVDGTAYGFSDSDVADKFLELTGGTMSGDIDMGKKSISNIQNISFNNTGTSMIQEQAPGGGMNFYAGTAGKVLLALSPDNTIVFAADNILGVPNPVADTSPISKEYLETNVIDKIGAANGIAELDNTGKVPSTQLPSYVDDVLEYSDKASFPATGESGKLYIDLSNDYVWRWGGSVYVNVSDGNAHLTLGTSSSTAYRGDRGKTAYDHSQLTGTNDNPHNITAANVGLGNVLDFGIALKSEAEAGAIGNKYMTPQRTKEAIENLAPRLTWQVIS